MKQQYLETLKPWVCPELDPEFRPAALKQKALKQLLGQDEHPELIHIALMRPDGSVDRSVTHL
ncbi:MAG: hypothetical protein VW804_03185, partial [Verrucomicrobiota bacterium]